MGLTKEQANTYYVIDANEVGTIADMLGIDSVALYDQLDNWDQADRLAGESVGLADEPAKPVDRWLQGDVDCLLARVAVLEHLAGLELVEGGLEPAYRRSQITLPREVPDTGWLIFEVTH